MKTWKLIKRLIRSFQPIKPVVYIHHGPCYYMRRDVDDDWGGLGHIMSTDEYERQKKRVLSYDFGKDLE